MLVYIVCYKAQIEGISQFDADHIGYAKQLGYRIKLLGITQRRSDEAELRVHPTLIPAKRLIADVEGAMNAVRVQGDTIGAALNYGKGAGAEPTPWAAITDLAHHHEERSAPDLKGVSRTWQSNQIDLLMPVSAFG